MTLLIGLALMATAVAVGLLRITIKRVEQMVSLMHTKSPADTDAILFLSPSRTGRTLAWVYWIILLVGSLTTFTGLLEVAFMAAVIFQ